MPPHLDLTKTYTHADMILSSRNSPRLSLRRAASYNPNDRGPMSSTSSRFSFNHIISSPPPSPSLPALIPRHGKPVPTRSSRTYLRGLLWMLGVGVLLYYGLSRIQSVHSINKVGWAQHAAEEYEMVGDSELPDFPTPVIVADKRGKAKWTVSIPPSAGFPLTPSQYAEICTQAMAVSDRVKDLHNHIHRPHGHFGYYHVDPYFMDVVEAEGYGLLPGSKGKTNMKNQDGSIVGEHDNSLVVDNVCEKTMTFVMETSDAGLGKSLMMLWSAYGLAQREGRDFFVDDSRWAYGRYANFFEPPPTPNCRPPPRHEMLPCPHHARHLLVSAATTSHTFGGAFNEEFEDPRKMEVYRQKPMFDLARVGYEALFHLSQADRLYVNDRVSELSSQPSPTSENPQNGVKIGIHIRHGDRHPYEFQYQDSYVPLERYGDKARELLQQTTNATGLEGDERLAFERNSLFVVASDDPDVYGSDEFASASRAQAQINLASRIAVESSQPSTGSAIRKFVDETVGWEGGFFAAMFWSLGKPSSIPANAVKTPDTTLPPTEETLRLRELVGRAYLIDLAVLGRASDRIVCTVSSMGCRLLAVMMGWEHAIVKQRWVNVDGEFEWRGVSW